MKKITEFLFGRVTNPLEPIKLGFKTSYPPKQPSEFDWMIEYRVGTLYDRKIVHF
jgi:hypothetical protein